jgi:hypothetical protein
MGQWRQAQTGTQRYTRVRASVPVRISTVDAERDPDTGKLFFRSTETTTANLSRGGAYVHSWEPLAAGRSVVMSIDLPSGQEIQVVARVAWTRRELRQADSQELQTPGYGLEFIGGTSAELAALDAFLSSDKARTQSSTVAPGAQIVPPLP